jgi:hypothetical protein
MQLAHPSFGPAVLDSNTQRKQESKRYRRDGDETEQGHEVDLGHGASSVPLTSPMGWPIIIFVCIDGSCSHGAA